jgi:hypothetical protein
MDKIQRALTESSAILVILSKASVESQWCKKELNAGFVRELDEKQVLLLPCVIEDCEIPLFLREKLYADFRKKPDEAFSQLNDSLLRITNRQQTRVESPDFHTDMSYDWKTGKRGIWYFDWAFVDHGEKISYCVLTRCLMACNDVASAKFQALGEFERQEYIHRALGFLSAETSAAKVKIRLKDAFEKFEKIAVSGSVGEAWFVEISSRRMGVDMGKDTLVHIDQILEQALKFMKPDQRPAKT